MFELRIDSLITTLRDSLCPPSGREQILITENGPAHNLFRGIMFCFDLRLSYKDYRESTLLWIVLCGNTNVFYVEQGCAGKWDNIPLGHWNNTSNHDSCWRSDGLNFLHKIYMRHADTINARMEADGLETVAPIQMYQHNGLGFLSHDAITRVVVDHELDKRYERHGNKRRLTKLIEVKP